MAPRDEVFVTGDGAYADKHVLRALCTSRFLSSAIAFPSSSPCVAGDDQTVAPGESVAPDCVDAVSAFVVTSSRLSTSLGHSLFRQLSARGLGSWKVR